MKRLGMLLLLFGVLSYTGCKKTVAPVEPPPFTSTMESSYHQGARVDLPFGGYVSVDGNVFQEGASLTVEASPVLSYRSPAAELDAYRISPVVTVRFRGEDFVPMTMGDISTILYGLNVALPVTEGAPPGNAGIIMILNDRYLLTDPFMAPIEAGSTPGVKIPLHLTRHLLQSRENTVQIFFARIPENEAPQYSWATRLFYGYKSSGSRLNFETILHAQTGNDTSLAVVFAPVRLLTTPGYQVGLPRNTANPDDNFSQWLSSFQQYLAGQLSLGQNGNKLITFYQFLHNGQNGFFSPADALWNHLKKAGLRDGGFRYRTPWDDVVILFGHSMGGLISRALAAKHPEAVGAIFTWDTPHEGSIFADMVVSQGFWGRSLDDYIYRAIRNPQDADQFDRDRNVHLVTFAGFGLSMARLGNMETYIRLIGGGLLNAIWQSTKNAATVLVKDENIHPYLKVCAGSQIYQISRPNGYNLPNPSPIRQLNRLEIRNRRYLSGNGVKVFSYMIDQNFYPRNTAAFQETSLKFQHMFGLIMAALENVSQNCSVHGEQLPMPGGRMVRVSLYPPMNSTQNYRNDGVVALYSGLWKPFMAGQNARTFAKSYYHPNSEAYPISSPVLNLYHTQVYDPRYVRVGSGSVYQRSGQLYTHLKDEVQNRLNQIIQGYAESWAQVFDYAQAGGSSYELREGIVMYAYPRKTNEDLKTLMTNIWNRTHSIDSLTHVYDHYAARTNNYFSNVDGFTPILDFGSRATRVALGLEKYASPQSQYVYLVAKIKVFSGNVHHFFREWDFTTGNTPSSVGIKDHYKKTYNNGRNPYRFVILGRFHKQGGKYVLDNNGPKFQPVRVTYKDIKVTLNDPVTGNPKCHTFKVRFLNFKDTNIGQGYHMDQDYTLATAEGIDDIRHIGVSDGACP